MTLLRRWDRRRGWIWVTQRLAGSSVLMLGVGLGLGAFVMQSAQAQTFIVLHNFAGAPDGAFPYGGLIRDAKDNFYGSSYEGGASGLGTVFKLSRGDTETVLHSFTGSRDGACPYGGLVRDMAGNLYGTTAQGGTSGLGVVFKVSPTGKVNLLHTFTGGADGVYPYGGLVRDRAGNLYGTTELGGAFGYGTVFKVDTNSAESVLHSFTGPDGEYPTYTGLLLDKEGNLYGVTEGGGASNKGVVYVLRPTGKLSVLHSFRGGRKDGCWPVGTPVMDTNGDLFGATEQCGSSLDGIVWKVSKKGTETVCAQLCGRTHRRGKSLRRCDSGREGQSLWGHPERRCVRLRNAVRAKYDRQTEPAAQLSCDRRRISHRRVNPRGEGGPLRHRRAGGSHWLWGGVQDDALVVIASSACICIQ